MPELILGAAYVATRDAGWLSKDLVVLVTSVAPYKLLTAHGYTINYDKPSKDLDGLVLLWSEGSKLLVSTPAHTHVLHDDPRWAQSYPHAHRFIFGRQEPKKDVPDFLTPSEHKAITLAGELASLLSQNIIGDGPSRDGDVNEVMTHIHAIQHTVMAQAAARAYPNTYRLLGRLVGDHDVDA